MGRIYIVLTPEQLQFIKREIASGKYKTRAQALKIGFQRLKEREAQKGGENSKLRVALKTPTRIGNVR